MGVRFKEGIAVDDDTSHRKDNSDSSISSVSTIGDPDKRIHNSTLSDTEETFFSTLLAPIKSAIGLISPSHTNGTNALFRAISDEDWDLVIAICERKPSKAAQWQNTVVRFFERTIDRVDNPSRANDKDDAPPPPPPTRSVLSRMLPLHYACIFHPNSPTRDAIRHLMRAYPTALMTAEGAYGRLPLHIACHSNASPTLIHELTEKYPDALFERDGVGRVPLHYALSNRASNDVIDELLLQASLYDGDDGKEDGLKRLCSMPDANGWLPLHVACSTWESTPESSSKSSDQKIRMLRKLVDAYPDAVDCNTNKNSSPLSLLEAKFHPNSSSRKRDEIEAIFLVQSRNENKSDIMSDGYNVTRRTMSSPARVLTSLNGHFNVTKVVRLVKVSDDIGPVNQCSSTRDIVKSNSSGTFKTTYDKITEPSKNADNNKKKKVVKSLRRGFRRFSCIHGHGASQN